MNKMKYVYLNINSRILNLIKTDFLFHNLLKKKSSWKN